MVSLYLEGVRKVSGRCLESVWKVSGRCLEGFWKVSKRVQAVSGLYPIEGMGIRGACNTKLNCKHTEDEEDNNDDDMATLLNIVILTDLSACCQDRPYKIHLE